MNISVCMIIGIWPMSPCQSYKATEIEYKGVWLDVKACFFVSIRPSGYDE